ncbi:MAG: DNA polymerase III subunit alpha [Bacteroidia bacterium]
MKFSHLHVHTQFSLLDGAADITALYNKAVKDKMPGIAITDHGNMFGVFKFVAEASKHNTPENPNAIKPIVGCEFYLVADRTKKQFTKDDKDQRYHQLFLAKNAEGYRNLIKLCSLGYMEGLYGKYPRIDKELVLKYHKGLIATTCCLGAMIPRTILRKGEAAAETEFKWWLDLFGDDYYIELHRHEIPEQNEVNKVLLKFAEKYKVKSIASNDSHYVDQQNANAHDILLCVNTGEKQSTPTIKEFADDDVNVRGKRFAFYNDQFYFKNTGEMSELFKDVPQSIDNTNEIVDKIEPLKLKQDIMLPHYKIPEGFTSQDEYLKHLTFEGAKKRYGDSLTPETEERINFELFTVKTMGFAGYFLIVADFINHGKDIGVFVGPGRGSAAGSVIAYCISITNIDPIKYNLLFERFLNPDRKSMPDIDTDFDDVGRQKVIDYVVEKYGKNQVAQIVTYGTMAAKSSIKDVARVLDLPLSESIALTKLVPERPGIELNKLLTPSTDNDKSLKEYLGSDEMEAVKKLREILKGDDLRAKVLKEALVLEGSVRNTGIHASAIIIAPKDLTEIIPVATSKETTLLITQFEGKIIEDAGVLKMDFLGLKTLTILRDALKLIKENHDVDVDIDALPLDDKKTFELYQRGDTNGTFQFESAGMQKYLKDLKPDKFEDLIAMNALYRPGPMEYIPLFIARKHKREKVNYDLPEMEEFLLETYGVTVYQEQVMLLSQKLAGFTKGDADVLRKAMGKKQIAVLNKMKDQFFEGAEKNGHPKDKLEKIWTDWESFAQYAFNKSHSTCYAYVAFQTAYLKAHYSAEYMAAVLTHNLSNIDKITFFMEECRRMGQPVLGPEINESSFNFSVNKKGEIRFGLAAIKGVGETAAQAIIEERNANGNYTSVFDLLKRVSMRSVNKKSLESLVKAGAFDCFKDVHRAQYLAVDPKDNSTGLDKAVRFANSFQDAENRNQQSLFGDHVDEKIPEPKLPVVEPWDTLEKLRHEKDVIGFYISGHPLDLFKYEIKSFCNEQIKNLKEQESLHKLSKKRDFTFAGIVAQANHRVSKTGKRFGTFMIEDLTGSMEIALFHEKKYIEYEKYLKEGMFLFIKATAQLRYQTADQYELQIQEIKLLSEVGNEMAKSITLITNSKEINELWVDKIISMLTSHPGKIPVKVALRDDDSKSVVEGSSKKIRVSFDKHFFDSLENTSGIDYKIN